MPPVHRDVVTLAPGTVHRAPSLLACVAPHAPLAQGVVNQRRLSHDVLRLDARTVPHHQLQGKGGVAPPMDEADKVVRPAGEEDTPLEVRAEDVAGIPHARAHRMDEGRHARPADLAVAE